MLATNIQMQMHLATWQGRSVRRLFASGTVEHPGKEFIYNETARQAWTRKKKKTSIMGSSNGFDSMALAPISLSPWDILILEAMGEGRLQTQRVIFSLKEFWLASLHFSHSSLHTLTITLWTLAGPATVRFFIPLDCWVWLTQSDSKEQHLTSVFKLFE